MFLHALDSIPRGVSLFSLLPKYPPFKGYYYPEANSCWMILFENYDVVYLKWEVLWQKRSFSNFHALSDNFAFHKRNHVP